MMKADIISGKIDIGEPVCARQCTKTVIDKSGNAQERVITVEARKHPIYKLRKKKLKKTEKYMRDYDDDFFLNMNDNDVLARCKSMGLDTAEIECMSMVSRKEYIRKMSRTRHLKMWHDGSGIENHGHILFCVSILYDPEVFYTDLEYHQKFGESVNIQEKVEKPEVYMVGRCKNNDEQLAYIPTRIACLKSLKQL